MRIYVVIDESGTLVGTYSCGTDACEVSKVIPGSSVTICQLNTEVG
jgi:hypothetical protein